MKRDEQNTKTNKETNQEKAAFPRLRRAVLNEARERMKKARFMIKHGYGKDYPAAEQVESLLGIEYYGGRELRERVERGEISKAEAIRIATDKKYKETQKALSRDIKKIDAVAAYGFEHPNGINYISILIEWKRSKTWGYNPHAYINIYGHGFFEHYEGSASGCGYDKRSAAVGEALNKSKAILYCLYSSEEKRLAMRKKEGKDTSRRDILGYGSGCGTLPYFEGGVGIESHRAIFRNIGFSWDDGACSDTVDTYTITANKRRLRK